MEKELEELQPKLVVAQEENAKMVVVIEKESAEVEARSEVVREVANDKAAKCQVCQKLQVSTTLITLLTC